MKITLTFVGGIRNGDTETLDLSSPALVGRSSQCQLKIHDPSNKTSKQHFKIRATDSGVEATCLGSAGMKVGGRSLASGEAAALSRGALIELPDGSKLRVDAISAGGDSDETVLMADERPTGGTGATAFPTAATAYGEVKRATGATAFPTGATAFPKGATAATAYGTMDTPTGPSGASDSDSPTFDAPSVAGGQTIAGKTRPGTEKEWQRIIDREKREQRFRQKMKSLAIVGAVALVALIVWWRWPTEERWLSHPRPIAQHVLKDGAGRVEMVVDYPDSGSAHVSRRGDGGIEVLSVTGKRRDVEFRLMFDCRKKEEVQLRLSLEDAAAREVSDLASKGFEFFFPEDDVRLAPGEQDGFFFFEGEYPKSCQTKTLRGVRFFKKEFVRSEGGRRWHGVLIFFRNGDTAYRLVREIPDGEWERGKWLLRADPNLALYATFLNNQWESPGEKALFLEKKREDLRQSVDCGLMRNNPSEWERTAHEIDTLVVMSWNASAEERRDARLLLEKFRKQGDVFYKENYHRSRIDGGEASGALKGAFHNERDFRWFRVNSEKVWL